MAKSRTSYEAGGVHPRWQGPVVVNNKGYVKVNVGKEHPLADKAGQCSLHLLVWVAAGRPKPAFTKALHHVDENKENNRLRNLEEVDADAHGRRHHYTGVQDCPPGDDIPY